MQKCIKVILISNFLGVENFLGELRPLVPPDEGPEIAASTLVSLKVA